MNDDRKESMAFAAGLGTLVAGEELRRSNCASTRKKRCSKIELGAATRYLEERNAGNAKELAPLWRMAGTASKRLHEAALHHASTTLI
jgi:hypothetical protein